MPIEIACPGCQKRMRAPDAAAGKHVKCPACQAPIVVPTPRAPAPVERWTLLTENDQQFGPIPRSELNEWFAEGRISAQCQLLKEGAPAWQWASEVYPALAQKPAPTPAVDPLARSPVAYAAPQPVYSPAPVKTPTYRTPHKTSGGANTAMVMAYVGGGAIALRALIALIYRAMWFSSMPQFGSRFAAEAMFDTVIWVGIIIVMGVVGAAPYFVAGFGLGQRRFWGKIMGFVTSGLSCLIALVALMWALRGMLNYARLSTVGFAMPAEFHLRAAGGILLDLLFLAIMIGHAIMTLMVLLNQKNAAEFQR